MFKLHNGLSASLKSCAEALPSWWLGSWFGLVKHLQPTDSDSLRFFGVKELQTKPIQTSSCGYSGSLCRVNMSAQEFKEVDLEHG